MRDCSGVDKKMVSRCEKIEGASAMMVVGGIDGALSFVLHGRRRPIDMLMSRYKHTQDGVSNSMVIK